MSAAKIKPQKILLPAALLLAALLIVFLILKPTAGKPKLPPGELCAVAVEELLALDSLSFHTETELLLNDESVKLGKLDGEINGADIHVWGEVLGSALNIYQLGNTTYRQDTITEQWLTTDDKELLNNESLLYDADPRAFFDLAAISDAAEQEAEDIDEEKCWKLTFTPKTQSGYYEKYFDSLTCTLWLTMDDCRIRQAEINAAASAAGQNSCLTVQTEFWAWNDTPPIEPPILQPANN